jgi:hypothetical protein
MAEAYTLSCPGVVSTGADGSALCTDGAGNVVQWVSVPPFDVSQLDYGQAGSAFAAGFVIVGMCWALGRAVGAILDAVRKS